MNDLKIAVNTDTFTKSNIFFEKEKVVETLMGQRVGAHPYIIKELIKRDMYTQDVNNADVVWNIDSIHDVGIKKGKRLTIYWELDDFMIHGKNPQFYSEADILYVNMPEYIYHYPERTKILRVACDPDIHREAEVLKDFDYSFIGSIEPLPVYMNRIAILDKLLKKSVHLKQKILISHGGGQEYVNLMSRGKIILDIMPIEPQSGNVCLHMRLYESMAVGCLMVLYHPFLDKLFQKDVHYVTLDKFGLMSDEEIEKVKVASRKLMIEKHTWSHRVEQVLQDIYEHLNHG